MAELQFYNLPNSLGAGLDIRHAQQKSYLAQLQAEMEGEKFARSTTAYNAQQKLLDSITDPQQRLAAIMAPEKFAGSIFRDPKDYMHATEAGAWNFSDPKNPVFTPSPNYGLGVAPLAGGAGSNLANALPQATPQANGPPVPLTSGYAQSLGRRENTTGNPAQPNLAGASSAVGDHQFLAGTWLDMIRTHRPDLAQGKSDTEILKLRENADLSAAMADSYAADNTPLLQRAGFEPSRVNLAILHGFGPTGGLKILQAERQNPNTPLESVLSAEALAANPELRGMTIAQGRAQLEQQMAGAAGGGAAAAPAAGAPQPASGGAPQGKYPPGAVAFRTDKKTGQYVTGGKAGWGVLVDQAGNQIGTAPLPGQETENGPFASNSIDANAYNILLTGDPSTPEYALAYHQATAPKYVQVQDPNDQSRTITVSMQPQLPPNIRKPTYVPAAAANAAPGSPAGSPVPAIANPPATATPVPGTERGGGPTAADRSKLKAAEIEVGKIKEAMRIYRGDVEATGGPGMGSLLGLPTRDASRLNTSYNNMALLAKGETLYQLGVLNGPDLDLIRRTLLDPSTWQGVAASKKVILRQVDQVEHILDTAIAAARKQYGDTGKAADGTLHYDAEGNLIP